MQNNKKYNEVVGELEWDLEGFGNYYTTKEITLFDKSNKLELVFNIDKVEDNINQRQIDNFNKIMYNPQEIYEKAIEEVIDYFNEVIIKFELYDPDEVEVSEKVNTIEEILEFIALEPPRIYLDGQFYDMAICMGCSWDMEGGLVVKINGDEIEIGNYDSAI